MEDLRIQPGPGAPSGLVVPAAELIEQFSRATGPGGQGVNTTDSHVQLSLDLATTSALSEEQRSRALRNLASRLKGTVITISAKEHRSQYQNRAAARRRLATLLRDAVAPQSVRKPTRPTLGSKQRRIDGKRMRSEVKQMRQRPRSY